MLSLKLSLFFSCAILLAITADMVHSKYVPLPNSATQWQISQNKEVATWEEAKNHCESEGATLASPISEELLQYMKTIIAANNHTTPYFIGFKARNNTEFRSEEGILLQDVGGVFDLVEQIDPREGDCLCMDGHSIRVEPCWSRLPFMCYMNSTTDTTKEVPPTTTEESIPTCGPGYLLSRSGSFYRFHDEEVSWSEANSTCAEEGGYLIILDEYSETRIITYLARAFGPYFWVGVLDVTGTSDWRTIKGDPFIQVYHEVDPARSKGNCIALKFNGLLTDKNCYDRMAFICEKDSPCRLS